MKALLLDTHVFYWALAEPDRMPPGAWGILEDASLSFKLSVQRRSTKLMDRLRPRWHVPGGTCSLRHTSGMAPLPSTPGNAPSGPHSGST